MRSWPWWLRFTMITIVLLALAAGFLLMVHDMMFMARNWWFIRFIEEGGYGG